MGLLALAKFARIFPESPRNRCIDAPQTSSRLELGQQVAAPDASAAEIIDHPVGMHHGERFPQSDCVVLARRTQALPRVRTGSQSRKAGRRKFRSMFSARD